MNMTLHQLKNYITGVLKGWLTNKATIDKFSESDNELLWGGEPIKAGASQVIRVRENISAKYANPQGASTGGNTKNSDGGGWLLHPITDYDEIIVSIKHQNNIFYSEPVPVSRIVSGRNDECNEKNTISVVSPFNPNVRFIVAWTDVNMDGFGSCSPEECDFMFMYDIPAGQTLQYAGIEGIKYATIPTNEEFIAKNLIGRSFNVILNKTLIPVRQYVDPTLQQFAELSCSIEEYDELIIKITVDWKINNVLSVNHFVQHDNVPIVSAKEYGHPCANFAFVNQDSCAIGFIDDTHLGVLWCNKETSCNGMYVAIAGVKYETITDPITNAQVSTAVTETLGTLNMEGENES